MPMSYDTSNYFWWSTAGPEFQDADAFEFSEAARGGQLIEEDLRIGQVDLQARPAVGRSRRLRQVRREVHRAREHVRPGHERVRRLRRRLPAERCRAPGDPDFYSQRAQLLHVRSVSRLHRADQFFRDNEGSFEISDADTIAESFGVDYRVKETVTAGYLMGQLQVGSATFIGGVRVEQTDTDFDAFDIVFVDGDAPNPPPQVHGSKKYTNVLPDLLMTWAIREDLLLRAAWTNTIGRPSYEQNVPFRIFEIEEGRRGDTCSRARSKRATPISIRSSR